MQLYLPGNRLGRGLVVPGEHHHVFHAQAAQLPHDLSCLGPGLIGQRNQPEQLPVAPQGHHRMALRGELFQFAVQFGRFVDSLFQQPVRAEPVEPAVDPGGDASAGQVFVVGRLGPVIHSLFPGVLHHGLSQRVGAAGFQRRGQPQQLVLVGPVPGDQFHHPQPAHGQRAGFVQGYRPQRSGRFEIPPRFDQHAPTRRGGKRRHDGNRGGDDQRAGTSNYQ